MPAFLRMLLLSATLLAGAASAQTIDDDLLAAQMNYHRASGFADKATQAAQLARQAREQAEVRLRDAQTLLERAQAEQASAEASERDALAELGAARQRLEKAGVRHIYGGEECTVADSARFFSYRRDGVTGRMASLIWLE